jgi:double-strand break repair protein AddB
MVRKLINNQPGIAPPAAAFDLADSLATLMDEMHGEGVSPDALSKLNIENHSEYWARSLQFINLVQQFSDENADLDTEARQRQIVTAMIQNWKAAPPQNPVIVAGSTGSRATTRMFMEAVANLPQGAIILPGFDFEMPASVWDTMSKRNVSEDHPQYRFKALMDALDTPRGGVQNWTQSSHTNKTRNALVSLALRPAPVTDAWLREGPSLTDIPVATKEITLVEAPSPRVEAMTIAYGIREAIEARRTVALITPDRVLTRQVTAALQRWAITPDDSAGLPLALSAPGRLLRQTAALMGTRMTSEALLALLKHPLVAKSGDQDRGTHLQNTRDLELDFLRGGPPFPDRITLEKWLSKRKTRAADLTPWLAWVTMMIEALEAVPPADLSELEAQHRTLTEQLCAGPNGQGSGELWDKEAGEAALSEMNKLRLAAPSGGQLSPREYRDLLGAIIAKGEVRNAVQSDARAMIWGTLESRVQGADLIIMAGLNEGVWPEAPTPDPWLNRQMREDAGLLLPERNIGLSAHDFQQAITAPTVWITRSTRNAEAETVPSRWLNRLRNLLEGLPNEGAQAFKDMKSRGDHYLSLAAELERPKTRVNLEKRPSPQPPIDARPKKLSVTRIEKLIRDPYAIYARYILNLAPLRDLTATADAPMRGEAIHTVLERFVRETAADLGTNPLSHLMKTADDVFANDVPWPAVREMWRAKLSRAAPWFIQTEIARRDEGQPLLLGGKLAVEKTVHAEIKSPEFRLEGRIDRVDQLTNGRLVLYDYKTGALPTDKQEKHFNKQLPLLAAMVYLNGIDGNSGFQIARTSYLGLGSDPKEGSKPVSDPELDEIWDDFTKLIAEYADPEKGYAARRAVFETRFGQDYDHLSRFGEWSATDDAVSVKVGQ